jgi:ATP adenylyltransferase/5',5'''-P-1,P-4-tetraphosphate phosphorylase II
MQLSIKEKCDNFISNVDFDNFLDFYYSHNDRDVINEFNLSWSVFEKLKKDYNLHKTREQIISITKNTWAEKPTSFVNKHARLKEEISYNDLYDYYISNNHRFEDTCNHFNINAEGLLYLTREYKLQKDGKLLSELSKETKLNKYKEDLTNYLELVTAKVHLMNN